MLAKADKYGIPSLQVVEAGNVEFRHLKKLYTTMVVKRKTTMKFKGGLCARGIYGDLISPWIIHHPQFPAALRDY